MRLAPSIPGYDLIQRLGGGPLTSVYAARQHDTESACAVKVLRPDWEDQPTAIKLLQREARAGLRVRHPQLVQVLEAHVTRPPYFLVMELLPGETLRRRLRREYRLDIPQALWITRQMAEALAALHRAGLVHADVKPDNIRLVDDGSARLIDLGFARRPGEDSNRLKQGYILGTANYLAPELAGFESDAVPASDIFSLGVTLFEMLAGRLPYPPGPLRETLRRHHCDPPADLLPCAGPLPPALVGLVERMLQRRPADRPRIGAIVQQLIGLEIAALGRGTWRVARGA